MSTKDYRTKDEIIVSVNGKGSDADGDAESSRPGAVIPSKKRRSFLPRRGVSGINFIDLGRLKAGGENLAHFAPTISRPPSDLNSIVTPITDPQKIALVSDLQNAFFTFPSIEWKNQFEKITKGSAFEKAITVGFTDSDGDPVSGNLSEIDNWTSSGLDLTGAEVATLAIAGHFLFDCLLDFSAPGYRITTIRDPAAPEAAFTALPKMTVYLAPALIYSSGLTGYTTGLHLYIDGGGVPHSDVVTVKDTLNAIYSVLPRFLYADFLHAIAETDGYQLNYKIWQILKQFNYSRLLRGTLDFHEIPPYSYFTVWQDLPPSDFPYAPLYTPGGLNESGFVNDLEFGSELSDGLNFDRFVLAVEQNGQFFYFWKT